MNPKRSEVRRVRWTLLMLLWAWAACMALVCDLFLNVDEFDGVRPRAPLYQAMRAVAHEMVGEPCMEPGVVKGARARAVSRLAATAPAGHPRQPPSNRIALVNGHIDPRTPQGARLKARLARVAESDPDPHRRAAAERSLERMFADEEPALAVRFDPLNPRAAR